jgi:putative restriction endonuclease
LPELNFWAPSAASFGALKPGELFLFKLHAPRNVIICGGIFAYANALPCSLAWQAFGAASGARSAQEMRARIARYRRADPSDRSDFETGETGGHDSTSPTPNWLSGANRHVSAIKPAMHHRDHRQ